MTHSSIGPTQILLDLLNCLGRLLHSRPILTLRIWRLGCDDLVIYEPESVLFDELYHGRADLIYMWKEKCFKHGEIVREFCPQSLGKELWRICTDMASLALVSVEYLHIKEMLYHFSTNSLKSGFAYFHRELYEWRSTTHTAFKRH